MFVLWYTTLSWKEYRDISSGAHSKAETSSIQVPDKVENSKSNINEKQVLEIPKPQDNLLMPNNNQNNVNKKLVRQHSPHPVLKPNYNIEHKDANSHMEEEEFVEDEEELEEEEEVEEDENVEEANESEEEEDEDDEEQNSVVEHMTPSKPPPKDFSNNVSTKQNVVNDFIKQEISSQKSNDGNKLRFHTK